MNKRHLKDLKEEELTVTAICLHRSTKNFDPAEGNAGEVGKTSFQKELRLKLGVKVMLTLRERERERKFIPSDGALI